MLSETRACDPLDLGVGQHLGGAAGAWASGGGLVGRRRLGWWPRHALTSEAGNGEARGAGFRWGRSRTGEASLPKPLQRRQILSALCGLRFLTSCDAGDVSPLSRRLPTPTPPPTHARFDTRRLGDSAAQRVEPVDVRNSQERPGLSSSTCRTRCAAGWSIARSKYCINRSRCLRVRSTSAPCASSNETVRIDCDVS